MAAATDQRKLRIAVKPERWLRVKELFEAALEREAEERSAFLDEACAGDESLRVEVEGLIVSYGQDKSFMERPAVAGAARSLLEDQTTDLPERSEDDLSGSPSLLLNTDVPGGDGAAHDAKSGAANRRRIILVGLFFSLMSVGVGVNSYHTISYFGTAGDPGWLLGFDGRVRKYDGVSAADSRRCATEMRWCRSTARSSQIFVSISRPSRA